MANFYYQRPVSAEDWRTFSVYLSSDEKLELVTGLSWSYLGLIWLTAVIWPGGILTGLGILLAYLFGFNLLIGLALGLIGAGFLAWLQMMITYHTIYYLVTDKRLIIKKGLLVPEITSAYFNKITAIKIEQNWVEKILLKQGTLVIELAGVKKGTVLLSFVAFPGEFKSFLEQLIKRERERSGLPPGPVVKVEGELV